MMRRNALYFKTIVFLYLLALGAVAGAATQERPDPELRKALTEAIKGSDSFTDRFHAEVWLMDMSNRLKHWVKDDKARLELLKNVHYEATRAGLPPELVISVIDVESNFNRWAISVVGAQGLMQVMPFWLKEIGRPGDNLFDIRTNLRMGCTILAHYMKREKGNIQRALARYNGSLGSVRYPNKVFGKLRKRWYRR